MQRSRPQTRQWRLWPFGRKRNRRVRPPSLSGLAPVPTPEPPRPGRRRAWLLGLVTVLLAGTGLGAWELVTRAPHFAVKKVRFSMLVHASEEALAARAGVNIGTNLFAVDLAEVVRDVSQEPWVLTAHARRELPSTIVVDVVERSARCVVALGGLYLADARGAVFKRANPDEAASFPVVTGVEREAYLSEPQAQQARIREAIAVVGAWQATPSHPPIGEVHVDRLLGATLYTGAVAVRIGRVDDTLQARLHRFDAVWAALQATGEQARIIYVDNRARPDRVTVKLTTTQKSET